MKINEHHFCNFEDFVKHVVAHYEQIASEEEETEQKEELVFELDEKLDFYAKLGYLEGSIDCAIIDIHEGNPGYALSTLERLKEYISTGF
jgi:hypothetical protein